jgi:hypothetical protein
MRTKTRVCAGFSAYTRQQRAPYFIGYTRLIHFKEVITLKKKHIVLFSLCLALTFILGFVCSQPFFKTPQPERTTTFYAHVLENRETSLHVEGIPENDIDHRGQFFVWLEYGNNNAVVLNARGTQINLSEIPHESLVRIEYRGPVHKSYPEQIRGAFLIRLEP